MSKNSGYKGQSGVISRTVVVFVHWVNSLKNPCQLLILEKTLLHLWEGKPPKEFHCSTCDFMRPRPVGRKYVIYKLNTDSRKNTMSLAKDSPVNPTSLPLSTSSGSSTSSLPSQAYDNQSTPVISGSSTTTQISDTQPQAGVTQLPSSLQTRWTGLQTD